ncbi:gamma-glutamyltransferase [Paenibacillus alginolyticus]|uniref:Glutathione hydrolase proenzyme n=1 Tax=Paenibacillus alginolyticus TaxID=59839 RepID=A0ABT4GIH8_9BACL|nr:gamma-glutamyltransferase [Paenibacillus alginolyticus]MCY9695965.1 gamma-glutamyltransferase [Paenibacillus alginolyticus]MEC0146819.1 gamma-glutamyltransferase [Paenibacillus alginolyticus]
MLNIMPRAERAMIATPHYLATSVGSAILQQGGNAFDSAIAISATLGVVYPHMTGLGGDAFFLMHDAATGTFTGFNGSGKSASQATPDFYKDKGLNTIPQRGILSAITVPGMVDAWWQVWEKYGKLPWEKLLDPAIAYAEKGFPISRNLLFWMRKDEAFIRASEQLSALYMANGELLKEGDRLVQKDMAHTLRTIQCEGRDAFYKGTLMQTAIDSIQRDGGLLQEDDFRTFSGEWVELLSTTYRGYDIYQMPPNSQGFTALMMMNMLENIEVSAVPRASANFYHLMSEVIKKAFKDRDLYLTDPHFREIPLERLLSKAYAVELWNEIQAEPFKVSEHLSPAIGQDTAYAAVVDDEGNSVSFIQSLYFDFGAAYVPGNTGIIMQNRGSFFSLDPACANVLEPNKRSFHTLMPAMVSKEGKPYMLFGTQGGEGQPQTQLSILTGVLDYGLSIQAAISLPRWVYGRTWGEDGDALKVEHRLDGDVYARLKRWGHRVEPVNPWDGIMGQAQGIVIDEKGFMSGAADPRGDGLAIGW